jgi:phosphoribosyl 1,2-cyclic phosphodiesterase
MFKTAVLASGSKGNCFLVKTENTKILVDAGLSVKKTVQQMQSLLLTYEKINAVIISHDHNDHIKGAGALTRKLGVPLYISQKTYLASKKKLGTIKHGLVHFENGNSFVIGDLEIHPFASSHDTADGSNFVIMKLGDEKRKLGIVTDLGYPSRLTIQRLTGVTTIILESNHDEKMLLEGPYPWELKQRVKSREGHLSNNQAVSIVSRIIHPELKNIILAHLSEKNNTPQLAYDTMQNFLESINFELNLIVSSQNEATELIDV